MLGHPMNGMSGCELKYVTHPASGRICSSSRYDPAFSSITFAHLDIIHVHNWWAVCHYGATPNLFTPVILLYWLGYRIFLLYPACMMSYDAGIVNVWMCDYRDV